MRGERVHRLTEILPDLDELEPVLDHVLAMARPDPRHTWSSAGEVETVGERLVDVESLEGAVDELAEQARERLAEIYGGVARVARALENHDRDTASRILVEIAESEEAAERPGRAEAYALAAVEVARELRDQRPLGLALRRAGRAARARGDLEAALPRYRKAWEICRVAGSRRDAAEAAIGAGNVLEEQGRWDEAETWYRRALERLDEHHGPAPERWHAALNLHIVLRSRGELDAARPWLEEAEKAAAVAEDPAAVPFLGSARGQLLMAEGDVLGADESFRRALGEADGARARVTIRLNLAESLLAQGRILEAGEEAREAEREALAASVVSRLPEVYRLLGRIAARNENPNAFVLFERALELVRERELPPFQAAVTLQAYAEAERGRGEEDTARALLHQAKEIFRELGIRHLRRRWVDLFGPTGDEAFGGGAEDGSTDENGSTDESGSTDEDAWTDAE